MVQERADGAPSVEGRGEGYVGHDGLTSPGGTFCRIGGANRPDVCNERLMERRGKDGFRHDMGKKRGDRSYDGGKRVDIPTRHTVEAKPTGAKTNPEKRGRFKSRACLGSTGRGEYGHYVKNCLRRAIKKVNVLIRTIGR